MKKSFIYFGIILLVLFSAQVYAGITITTNEYRNATILNFTDGEKIDIKKGRQIQVEGLTEIKKNDDTDVSVNLNYKIPSFIDLKQENDNIILDFINPLDQNVYKETAAMTTHKETIKYNRMNNGFLSSENVEEVQLSLEEKNAIWEDNETGGKKFIAKTLKELQSLPEYLSILNDSILSHILQLWEESHEIKYKVIAGSNIYLNACRSYRREEFIKTPDSISWYSVIETTNEDWDNSNKLSPTNRLVIMDDTEIKNEDVLSNTQTSDKWEIKKLNNNCVLQIKVKDSFKQTIIVTVNNADDLTISLDVEVVGANDPNIISQKNLNKALSAIPYLIESQKLNFHFKLFEDFLIVDKNAYQKWKDSEAISRDLAEIALNADKVATDATLEAKGYADIIRDSNAILNITKTTISDGENKLTVAENRLDNKRKALVVAQANLAKKADEEATDEEIANATSAVTTAENIIIDAERKVKEAKDYLEIENAKEALALARANTAKDAIDAINEIIRGANKKINSAKTGLQNAKQELTKSSEINIFQKVKEIQVFDVMSEDKTPIITKHLAQENLFNYEITEISQPGMYEVKMLDENMQEVGPGLSFVIKIPWIDTDNSKLIVLAQPKKDYRGETGVLFDNSQIQSQAEVLTLRKHFNINEIYKVDTLKSIKDKNYKYVNSEGKVDISSSRYVLNTQTLKNTFLKKDGKIIDQYLAFYLLNTVSVKEDKDENKEDEEKDMYMVVTAGQEMFVSNNGNDITLPISENKFINVAHSPVTIFNGAQTGGFTANLTVEHPIVPVNAVYIIDAFYKTPSRTVRNENTLQFASVDESSVSVKQLFPQFYVTMNQRFNPKTPPPKAIPSNRRILVAPVIGGSDHGGPIVIPETEWTTNVACPSCL